MYYRYECTRSSESNLVVSQYIEPLIGLLRDPLTICSYGNIPPALQMYGEPAVQSKRFFLLGPSAPYENFSTSPISIAPWLYQQDNATVASSFVGARWFYEYFRLLSLKFDRIVAFEVQQYSPRTYWNQIPLDLISSLTFINVGVDKRNKFNPWNILKSTAEPSDYVVIKLDIDTAPLETELVNQILNDSSISSLIDEMFFEMHVTVNEMRPAWGSPPGTLADTYILFTKLRQLGIRMHSWP